MAEVVQCSYVKKKKCITLIYYLIVVLSNSHNCILVLYFNGNIDKNKTSHRSKFTDN